MPKRTLPVRWTESAAQDLEEIAMHVARDSPLAAERLIARLEQRASSVGRMPRRGRVVPELAFLGIQTWREVLSPPYRIIYRATGEVAYILGVLDGRRDLRDVLLNRLLRQP